MGIERWWRSTDRALVLVTLALTLLGLLFIGSASHINQAGLHVSDYLAKQAAFLVADIAIFVYLLRFDYRKLYRYAPALYAANLIVLTAVMLVGTSALGAQRWITIGPISIQPSEFAKIIYIVCLARFLCRPSLDLKKWSGLFYTALFLLPPFVLVLLQPDLGTSLVFGAITLGGLYIAGVRMDYIRKMCLAGLAVLPLAWFFLLKEYQKNRILVLFDPERDPFNTGYHVIQSKIAIGSGGLIGKGLFAGTQSQLNFLPENHTDFIFAVVGEETGLVGALLLLLLYFVLLYRGIWIASTAADRFGRYIATGIVAMWLFQIFINVGMTIGIMPVTGIPLPFLSYGVSSLTLNLCSVALLLNIYLRRKTVLFDASA